MTEDADAANDKAAGFAAKRAKRRPAPEIEAEANSEPVLAPADEIASPPDDHVEAAPHVAPDTPADEPPAATVPPSPPPPLPRRRAFGLPLAIGLLVGAAAAVAGAYALQALGFGAAETATARIDALDHRLDDLDRKVAADATLGSRLDALTHRVEALPRAPDTGAFDKRIATLEAAQAGGPSDKAAAPTADIGPLTERLGALESKVAGLPTAAEVAARVTAASAPQAAQAGLAALSTKVDALAEQVAPLEALAAPKTDVRAPQDRDSGPASQAARGPDLAIVAGDLAGRVASGKPFDGDLALLATLGADGEKLARLRPFAGAGVTKAADLAAQFAPLAGPILASVEPVRDESFLAHLERSAGTLVRIQKVDGSEAGTDLSGRVARLQAALARGDVSAALEFWRTLPPAAKAKSDAWGKAAGAHVEATDIAQALQSDAIALIGKGRS